MSKIIEKLARKVGFDYKGDLAYGRVNDVFFNVKFIRNKRAAPENLSEVLIYRKHNNPLAFIISPKYETAIFDVFVSRDKKVNLAEINDYVETYYSIFKVYRMNYIEDHFSFLLDKNQSFNIKISYIAQFLNSFSEYLKELGYLSSCIKCGSNDNITNTISRGMMVETCMSCALKESEL